MPRVAGKKNSGEDQKGLGRQVGGDHYQMPIQHSEFCEKNSIPYLDANCIKYIVRHRSKNGMEDLRKAKHYLEIIAQLVYGEDL